MAQPGPSEHTTPSTDIELAEFIVPSEALDVEFLAALTPDSMAPRTPGAGARKELQSAWMGEGARGRDNLFNLAGRIERYPGLAAVDATIHFSIESMPGFLQTRPLEAELLLPEFEVAFIQNPRVRDNDPWASGTDGTRLADRLKHRKQPHGEEVPSDLIFSVRTPLIRKIYNDHLAREPYRQEVEWRVDSHSLRFRGFQDDQAYIWRDAFEMRATLGLDEDADSVIADGYEGFLQRDPSTIRFSYQGSEDLPPEAAEQLLPIWLAVDDVLHPAPQAIAE